MAGGHWLPGRMEVEQVPRKLPLPPLSSAHPSSMPPHTIFWRGREHGEASYVELQNRSRL